MLEWTSVCQPGEFEPQAALMVGFNGLAMEYPRVLVEVVRHLVDRLPLVGIVDSEEQRQHVATLLCDWGLPAHLMHYVFMPVHGMWVRDFGPSFVRRSDGNVTILDAHYAREGLENDDFAPTDLARLLGLPVLNVPLSLEGGNILSNGQGFCLTSTSLGARNAVWGYDTSRIWAILDEFYGFNHGAMIDALKGEETGHVDMFATFVRPDTLVLGQYDPAIDPVNAQVLEANLDLLRQVRLKTGTLKIVRIPMPNNRDGIWRTYTNVVYANGILLVPSYPDQDPALERQAFEVYRNLLPDWQVVGIDCSDVIKDRGALRCITANIPWLKDKFLPPVRQTRPPLGRGPLRRSGGGKMPPGQAA